MAHVRGSVPRPSCAPAPSGFEPSPRPRRAVDMREAGDLDQPGWAARTGQNREEYQGHGWANAVHPDDAQATIDAWESAVARREMFIFEHRVRRHDGQWRLCAIRAIPVLDTAGEVIEWVGVHTDITDQRAAEEALREESRTLETLNKTGSTVAEHLDVESIVQTVTDAGVELTGAQFGAFFYNVINAAGESYMLFTLSGAHPSQFDFGMPRHCCVSSDFAGGGVIRSDDITADRAMAKRAHLECPKVICRLFRTWRFQ